MKPFSILTDSCIDLPAKLAEKLGLIVLPLSVTIEGEVYQNYLDEREITFERFYNLLRNEVKTSTSQANPSAFLEVMEPILARGEDILSISFSSALSGTYQSSVIAQQELAEKYPKQHIIVLDSMCASMGQGLLLMHASNMRSAGKSIHEVASWVEENKQSFCHLFTVMDLNHLRRGGRLSYGKAMIGTLLQIKPILHVSTEGKLVPVSKARGRRQALTKMIDRMEQTIDRDANEVVYLSHADCIQDVLFVKEEITRRLGITNIVDHYIGPVIGSHSGLHTLAIFYRGCDRSVKWEK